MNPNLNTNLRPRGVPPGEMPDADQALFAAPTMYLEALIRHAYLPAFGLGGELHYGQGQPRPRYYVHTRSMEWRSLRMARGYVYGAVRKLRPDLGEPDYPKDPSGRDSLIVRWRTMPFWELRFTIDPLDTTNYGQSTTLQLFRYFTGKADQAAMNKALRAHSEGEVEVAGGLTGIRTMITADDDDPTDELLSIRRAVVADG